MYVEPRRLKAFITDAGLLNEKQFDRAVQKAKKKNLRVEEVLLADGLVKQKELVELEAYILGIPFVDLTKETIPPDVLKIIPEPIARSNNIIAFRKRGRDLQVAMLDPEDLRTIEFIKKKADLRILPRLTTEESIKQALQQYQKTLEVEFGEIIKKEAGVVVPVKEEKALEDKEELQKAAEEMPIIKIVDTLMKHAVLQRASDIHIEPIEKEVIVRYRIDGILRDAMVLPTAVSSGIVARVKVLAKLKLDEHRLPQDGRFKVETEEYRYSIRVSVLPVADGEKIVMRLLSETSKAVSLEALGLFGDALEQIQIALKKPVGMLLVTGPTGSGKTTTLYSMMEVLNTPDVNISTVEDPIEYRMPRINQTQVNNKVGLTFANGLRSLLRQDPDIIMVGEVRDNETAGLAVNAALTGHLVLSTLHTSSAAGSIPRLLDMKAEPFLLSSTINILLAQRLVRKLCTEKKKYRLTATQIKEMGKHCDLKNLLVQLKKEKVVKQGATWSNIDFYHPAPSKKCPEGYSGRVGIFEVLPVTETIKELIMKGATADTIQQQAQTEGMRTMVEDGFIKAVQGVTTIEEVLRVIME